MIREDCVHLQKYEEDYICTTKGLLILDREGRTFNRCDNCPIYNSFKIKYHYEVTEHNQVQQAHEGEWFDLRVAEEYHLKKGEIVYLNTGVSIECPKGYEAHVLLRSSSPKIYGIIMANSMGVIDNLYSGDNDIWKIPVYATRDTEIPKYTRIAQFRLVKQQEEYQLQAVDNLKGKCRGGIGSTGEK